MHEDSQICSIIYKVNHEVNNFSSTSLIVQLFYCKVLTLSIGRCCQWAGLLNVIRLLDSVLCTLASQFSIPEESEKSAVQLPISFYKKAR